MSEMLRVVDARCEDCGHRMNDKSGGFILPGKDAPSGSTGFEIEAAALVGGVECYYCRGNVLMALEPAGPY